MSSLADRLAAARLRRPRPANDNFAAPAPLARSFAALLAAWWRRRRDRAELAQFGDRDLRDIGVTPAEAQRECAKPFWRA